MKLLLQDLKNYCYIVVYFFKKINYMRIEKYDVNQCDKNDILCISKNNYEYLIDKIQEENLNITVTTFFDYVESKACSKSYKDLWTNGEIDEKIHKTVQNKINPKLVGCEYLYSYEKLLRNEKILFILNENKLTTHLFCFLNSQFLDAQSNLRMLDSKLYFLIFFRRKFYKVFIVEKQKKNNKPFFLFRINLKVNQRRKLKLIWKSIIQLNSRFQKYDVSTNALMRFLKRRIHTAIKMLYSFMDFLQLVFHKKTKKNIDVILILPDGLSNEKYYRTALNIVRAFRDKKLRILILTPTFLTFVKLLLDNCLSMYLFVNIKIFLFREKGYYDEDSYYIDSYNEYSKYLKKIAIELHVQNYFFVPHWSYFSFNFIKIAKELSATTYSFPLVTVAPRASSIIGWNHLDNIFCYGYQCERSFKALNYNSNNLITIGNLYYNRKHLEKSKRQGNSILIATSRFDKNENEWIDSVLDYCERKKIFCYVNVHPSFSIQIYSQPLKKDRKYIKFLKSKNLLNLISQCLICITDCSTVGSEAIFLDKYLLTVNLTNKNFIVNNYAQYGVALEARTKEQIIVGLDSLYSDSGTIDRLKCQYQNFYDEFNFQNDGMAADRLASYFLDKKTSTQ